MPDKIGSTLVELVEVMEQLLGPQGCPWDREQSLASLRPYLIEECFELVDALDRDDVDNHKEELGDLLFQIVFQTGIRAQSGSFDMDDVVRGIRDKLIHRHPHVFAGGSAENSEEVLSRWEEIKAAEKAAKGATQTHLLDNVPASMPALSRAQKISNKVSRVGFDWPTPEACLLKVREECTEIEEALGHGDLEHTAEEIGDLLFATVSLARKLSIDAELALQDANRKFEARFRLVEDRLRSLGKSPKESDLTEMDGIWNEIKNHQTSQK